MIIPMTSFDYSLLRFNNLGKKKNKIIKRMSIGNTFRLNGFSHKSFSYNLDLYAKHFHLILNVLLVLQNCQS